MKPDFVDKSGLEGPGDLFTETTAYALSSPYSSSRASSDHLVRAWLRTYGMPVMVTNCSNNYGPYHFPEKLISLMILNALEEIAWRNGWLGTQALRDKAEAYKYNTYGRYPSELLEIDSFSGKVA